MLSSFYIDTKGKLRWLYAAPVFEVIGLGQTLHRDIILFDKDKS